MDIILKTASELLENKLVQSAIIILLGIVLNFILTKKMFRHAHRRLMEKREDLRYDTLFSVINKVTTCVIFFFVVLFLLQVLFHVNPSSLIAATGIVGVAVGLGSQSLIKDSINGFFILLENQYSVGELVTIESFTGTVSEMTLRITKIQNFNGDLLMIPNSAVTKVINHSRLDRGVFAGVYIGYDEDIDRVINILNHMGQQAEKEIKEILETPEVLGVTELGSSGIFIKMMIKCSPGSQFMIEREFLKRIRQTLAAEKIEIPYNHVVMISEDKETQQ